MSERLVNAGAVEVLDYLLHNLPPNLRVVVGTRPPVPQNPRQQQHGQQRDAQQV